MIIDKNLDNEFFDVPSLARQVHMSVSQLNRKLKIIINLPAGKLIQRFRMEHAAMLLVQSQDSVAQIACQVGFLNQAHFCRAFKRVYDSTPSCFRKRYCLVK